MHRFADIRALTKLYKLSIIDETYHILLITCSYLALACLLCAAGAQLLKRYELYTGLLQMEMHHARVR